MPLLIQLIIEFFKTGLFAIGGGLATIPFLQEMGQNYGWFSTKTLTTMIAVSESTPGAMGINMATYVGYETYGVLGAIVTTLSLVAPSIIVICLIAKVLTKFKESKIVKGIFYGIRPAVIAFIISACASIFLMTLFNIDNLHGINTIPKSINFLNCGVYGVIYFLYKKFDLHPIAVIVLCALIGILLKL